MSGARWFWWPATSALALLGCGDPGRHVNAHVTSAEECGTARNGSVQAHPVEGAIVTLRCPGESAILGKTGQDGRFAYAELGSLSADCIVHVSMNGYVARQYRVGDVCAAGLIAGHCPFVNLEPVLVRASAAPTAP